jgi:hypothetical protein
MGWAAALIAVAAVAAGFLLVNGGGGSGSTTAVGEPTELPDRTNCGEIRGTEFRSQNEQAFFTANCVVVGQTTASPVSPLDMQPFCAAASRFRNRFLESVRYQNDFIRGGGNLTRTESSIKEEFARLVREGAIVILPLPPTGAPQEAQTLYDLVRDLKVARDQLVTVVRASDHAGFNPANDMANSYVQDFLAYLSRICPGY